MFSCRWTFFFCGGLVRLNTTLFFFGFFFSFVVCFSSVSLSVDVVFALLL
jgi:hypothetical protein